MRDGDGEGGAHRRILEFWLGTSDEEAKALAPRWFKKDLAFDRQVRELFEPDLLKAKAGELDAWQSEPESCLAFIVLLDQFSRNMYRDTPASFATDERALAATLQGMTRGLDARLSPVQRYFFYMPLQHAEDRGVQRRSVEIFEKLSREAAPGLENMLHVALSYAQKHQEIVERFGRFPHRNALLGRKTTPEEEAFLKTPGSSF